MVVIEIPPNANCEPVEMRLFNSVAVPRPVRQIRLERTPGRPEWLDVTGWTVEGSSCAALAQTVDDSGEGLALLVYGGDAGLRLRRAGDAGPWRLEDSQQWGMPFVLTGDLSDVQFDEAAA